MGKYKLIINPTSGQGSAVTKIPLIEQLLHHHGLKYDLTLTERVGHAKELAEQAANQDYKGVIAAGGDGTINEILNGLMAVRERQASVLPFGVIPVGRGNDFVYGVDIPPQLETACRIIADGKTFAMDLGKISGGFYPEGRYFGNGIGIGFDTMVGLAAARMKHVHGFFAYIFGAFQTLFIYPEPPEIEIEFNGTIIKQQASQISIMNGKRMGGIFYMAPDASYCDGEFDLMVTEHLNRREMLKIIAMITKGTAGNHPKVRNERSSRFIIRSAEGRLVTHADGETVCTDGTELKVECLAGPVEIISEVG